MISIEVGEAFGAVVRSARSLPKSWRFTQSHKSHPSPVCKFSAEDVNRSELMANAHLMVGHAWRTVLQVCVLTNQNPTSPRDIKEIKIALEKLKIHHGEKGSKGLEKLRQNLEAFGTPQRLSADDKQLIADRIEDHFGARPRTRPVHAFDGRPRIVGDIKRPEVVVLGRVVTAAEHINQLASLIESESRLRARFWPGTGLTRRLKLRKFGFVLLLGDEFFYVTLCGWIRVSDKLSWGCGRRHSPLINFSKIFSTLSKSPASTRHWYKSVISGSSSCMFVSWDSAWKAEKCPLLRKCLRMSRIVVFSFCSL